jgi:hypothetical protein
MHVWDLEEYPSYKVSGLNHFDLGVIFCVRSIRFNFKWLPLVNGLINIPKTSQFLDQMTIES